MSVLLEIRDRGGLLLALNVASEGTPRSNPGDGGPVGAATMIRFGLIAAAAGIVFDRWTRDR